jgi:DUF971 family protein
MRAGKEGSEVWPRDPQVTTLRNIKALDATRELYLAWGDGHESRVAWIELRRACPCATCQHERGGAGPTPTAPNGAGVEAKAPSALRVIRGPSPADLAITRLAPVGRYAVQVVWEDGHDTGIFSFELLRSLCPCAECRGAGGKEATPGGVPPGS